MKLISGIEWIVDNEENRNRYNFILDKVFFSNIPQAWDYGSVKREAEGCNLIRGIIKDGSSSVGVIQILIKKKWGIPFAARVNRGPLLLGEYETAENHMYVMEFVRQHIPIIPILYAPNLQDIPKNFVILTKCGWRQWNKFGYETGIINLNQSLDQIRDSFNGKWRNQLKSSEKHNIKIISDFDRFDEIVSIYELSQKQKGYKGIPSNVLFGLRELKESPLKLFYILNESNDLIAFDFFYITTNFGLYFIGWNNDEGRKMYVNNLMLFHALSILKEMGVKWLDLGGIDYINTEENARFKDGMSPLHIVLPGEFIKF